MGLSASGILLNNHILNGTGFRFPLFLASIGQWFSAGVMWGAHMRGYVDLRGRDEHHITWRRVFVHISPISCLTAIKLGFGNAVYMHLSVAFIQILKGGVPMITLLAMVQYKLETLRSQLLIPVGIIAIGCTASINGELNASGTGLFFMVIGEAAEAYKTVRTQSVMRSGASMELTGHQTLAYMAPITALVMSIAVAAIEMPHMTVDTLRLIAKLTPLLSVVACISLGVNLISLLIIKRTCSLTLKVISQVKNTSAAIGGIVLFGDTVTTAQWVAYITTVIGYWLYHREIARPKRSESILP